LSVLLRFTASDYPFGIFKLFSPGKLKVKSLQRQMINNTYEGRKHKGLIN